MTGRRRYDDPCGIARALDAVGERWALLVVRELLFGPKRFATLSRGLPGMSQNVLSQRLRELEEGGIVHRRTLGPPASTRVYELTPRGRELEPVLLALAEWGRKSPLGAHDTEMSVDAMMLALRTTFDPSAAHGLDVRVALRFDDDLFLAEIRSGHLHVARADEPVRADATFDTDVATLRSLVFGRSSLLANPPFLQGAPDLAARFLACFSGPQPAVPADTSH
ncbi:winged helix-turn-helix transcriptional regulator [Actinomadura nitritigenes]|uniref:winged helix-turn-helix transcriptional regulator n=1 Tax=Actinomadura nitritigenes TaxID=134602 RepID=UPI0036B5D0AC